MKYSNLKSIIILNFGKVSTFKKTKDVDREKLDRLLNGKMKNDWNYVFEVLLLIYKKKEAIREFNKIIFGGAGHGYKPENNQKAN